MPNCMVHLYMTRSNFKGQQFPSIRTNSTGVGHVCSSSITFLATVLFSGGVIQSEIFNKSIKLSGIKVGMIQFATEKWITCTCWMKFGNIFRCVCA